MRFRLGEFFAKKFKADSSKETRFEIRTFTISADLGDNFSSEKGTYLFDKRASLLESTSELPQIVKMRLEILQLKLIVWNFQDSD